MKSQEEKTHPKFRDKEERRLITLESLKDLANFHEIEREEKSDALKIYTIASSIAVGLCAGLVANNYFSGEFYFIVILVLTVIIIVNSIMLKKIIAVRKASNNIYNEYGQRLLYLIASHSSDIDDNKKCDLNKFFNRYVGKIKSEEELFPKYSSDRFEIFGFAFANMLLSLLVIVPIYKIIKEFKEYFYKFYLVFDNFLILFSSALFSLIYFIITCLVTVRIICNEIKNYKKDAAEINKENKFEKIFKEIKSTSASENGKV